MIKKGCEMNEIDKQINDKFFQTMNGSINCASCDFMQRVGDNREFVICKKTNRELPSYDLNNYVDEKCPFLDETDIQRANDPKFTLKVMAIMIIVLFLSSFVIGFCAMFG